MSDVVFTTARLAMRDFRATDLEEVSRMWRDPDVARYMDDAPKSSTESAQWLEEVMHHNSLRPREAYNLAITVTGDDLAIGWVGFGPSARDPLGGTYGVGYLLDSACWRQGYMSEILPGVVAYVFDHLAGARLAAWCYADNVASARTLEKAGFTPRAYASPYPCRSRRGRMSRLRTPFRITRPGRCPWLQRIIGIRVNTRQTHSCVGVNLAPTSAGYSDCIQLSSSEVRISARSSFHRRGSRFEPAPLVSVMPIRGRCGRESTGECGTRCRLRRQAR